MMSDDRIVDNPNEVNKYAILKARNLMNSEQFQACDEFIENNIKQILPNYNGFFFLKFFFNDTINFGMQFKF